MSASPLLPCFASDAFRFGEVASMTVALTRVETSPVAGYLADLSPLRKQLIVGRGCDLWLSSNALPNPRLMQRLTAEGWWVARIGAQQVLASGDIDADVANRAALDVAAPPCMVQNYDAVEIALGDVSAAPLLAELCVLDLTQFATDAWIPTLFAGVEVGLYREPAGPRYRVVCASADGPYLFTTLGELTREFGGTVIGFAEYFNTALTGGVA
ncbi:MAG: hypothetical protein HYX63_22605 [Gammaproteobacteria bacterium]|nr:hypothetical protein [Gammaproteobacteria bacterium]